MKLPGDRFNLADVVRDRSRLTHVILPVRGTPDLQRLIAEVQIDAGGLLQILVEVTSQAEADIAVAASADGLIAKGEEAGGEIGDETSFVLLQAAWPPSLCRCGPTAASASIRSAHAWPAEPPLWCSTGSLR